MSGLEIGSMYQDASRASGLMAPCWDVNAVDAVESRIAKATDGSGGIS